MSGTLQASVVKDSASSTSNLTLDASGNVTVGNNLTVSGTGIMNIGSGQVYKDASGNVGIGTSSPTSFGSTSHVLQVQSSDATGYGSVLVGSGTYTMEMLVNQNSGVMSIGSRSNHNLGFATNDTVRATIDTNGNLLVGTTTVVNTGKVISGFNGSSAVGFVANDTASASGGVYFGCSLNGIFIGSIQRVGATSAVVYNTTSDQRLKTNVKDANPVLSALLNVKVRQYDWTDGDLHQEYGFVAQELEPVLSGIVTKGKTEEDMWQLDYSRLTPHLVKAIQELSAKVTALESR
jgi:hypothetical protein